MKKRIVICIASAVLGLVLSAAVSFSSLLFDNVALYAFIIFLGLSILTYYAQEGKNTFLITIPLSLVMSAGSWIGVFFARKMSENMRELIEMGREQSSGGVQMSSFIGLGTIDPVLMALIVIVAFNLFPLYKYFRH